MTPPYDYTNFQQSVQLAADLTMIGLGDRTQELLFQQITHDSRGSKGTVTYYRPYYVAATIIAQSPEYQEYQRLDSAEFTGMERAIAALLNNQAAIDKALDIDVPSSYQAASNYPVMSIQVI